MRVRRFANYLFNRVRAVVIRMGLARHSKEIEGGHLIAWA